MSIKSALTIALVPSIKSGPWIYWEDLESGMRKASALGFDGVELFTESGQAIDSEKLRKLSDAYQLQICAVGTGAGKVIHGLSLTDPDENIRKKAIAFIEEMITFGAEFQAPAIIGSMQGNVSSSGDRTVALNWLADALNSLGAKAQELGVPLIYEPLNRYETNIFNRFEDAVSFLKTLETRNVKLLADLFHMNIEEPSIPETIRKYGDYIGHVHFADSNRKAIGFGHTPMAEIASALKEINYSGFISAEAFPLPDSDTAAQQTLTSFNNWFKS